MARGSSLKIAISVVAAEQDKAIDRAVSRVYGEGDQRRNARTDAAEMAIVSFLQRLTLDPQSRN